MSSRKRARLSDALDSASDSDDDGPGSFNSGRGATRRRIDIGDGLSLGGASGGVGCEAGLRDGRQGEPDGSGGDQPGAKQRERFWQGALRKSSNTLV